ncbi:MAG TPA: hypothetical protein VKK79_19550 [Candidatus Lokiarchaeia archaeon]|nr:hypothetical protein [Candidatus Lokiarchaeia archaeon]
MGEKKERDWKGSSLKSEDPHQLAEDFTIQFRRARNSEEKKLLAGQVVSALEDIAHQSENAQDLYDIADIFYAVGNLVELVDMEQAREIYLHSLNTWREVLKSPYVLGKFYELGEIHVNMARIYGEKLGDRVEEHTHLHEAIILIAQEALLMESLGNFAKAAQIYYLAGELYGRVEDWEIAVQSFNVAMEMAKETKNFRLLFNTVESLVKLYRKLDHAENSSSLVYDTIEILLNESEIVTTPDAELQLAEIFQFVKKLHYMVGEQVEFEYFAKKEAAEYIQLAKKKKIENDLAKAATLYRGAALCFREINQHIDAGSCFHLAANTFKTTDQFASAADNYLDAARSFDHAKNLQKAADLLTEAGNCYIEVGNYDDAVDAFSTAFDLLDGMPGTENSNIKSQLGHKTAIVLSQVAQLHADKSEFIIAATLFLEAAVFLRRIGADWDTFILPLLRASSVHYWNAFSSELKGDPSASTGLWGLQAAVGAWTTGDTDLPEKANLKITLRMDLKHQAQVLEILQVLAKAVEEKNHDFIAQLSEIARIFFEESPELKKLCLFLEERIGELS